jgi:glycerate kinase
MSAPEAAAAIARGVQRTATSLNIDIKTTEKPLSDGGADFLDCFARFDPDARTTIARANGPLGSPLDANVLFVESNSRAILQLSSAAGLAQIPKDQRDPTRTTTYGVGQLILAALDEGARDITIGVGNSATVDAGAGALAALGVKFFDQRDQPIERPTGGDLSRIARIDASSLDPRLKRTKITVACDVDNPLLGHDGAAPTFAPQKGATPRQVIELERGLANFVEVLRAAGFDPKPDAPHTGAAGGFGFGLATVLGARLVPGVYLFLTDVFADNHDADLVLTGEGRIDAQTVRGKLPIAVAKEARKIGVPTIALVGSVGEGAEKTLDPAHASRPGGETDGGLLDYLVITPYGMPLDEALRRAPELLEAAAERAVREWLASAPSPRGRGWRATPGEHAG